MRKLLLLSLVFLTSLAFSQDRGSRYYTRGNSTNYQAAYQTQQRYYTGGNYVGGHGNGASQFQNQWAVNRAYQVDAYGRPIAGGQFGTQGQAERGYVHNNNPTTLNSIDAREAEIQRRHREYLDAKQSTYRVLSERHSANAVLANDNSAKAQERRANNNQFIDIFNRLDRIENNMHAPVIRGTDSTLPPVR